MMKTSRVSKSIANESTGLLRGSPKNEISEPTSADIIKSSLSVGYDAIQTGLVYLLHLLIAWC